MGLCVTRQLNFIFFLSIVWGPWPPFRPPQSKKKPSVVVFGNTDDTRYSTILKSHDTHDATSRYIDDTGSSYKIN